MERMSTLDAGFFYVEHDNVPMHLGSLALFEGPAPSYEELTRLIAAKLPRVPRYRQVVRTMPLEILRPMWVDDEHFEIGHHVRHAAVPAPGGKRQLRELAARIFATRLDRARPLWEAWLLEGLKGGRWAILSKVHHCVVDGIGGNDLMTAIFDVTPDAECPVPGGVGAGARPGHDGPDGGRPPGGGGRVGPAAVRPGRAAPLAAACPPGRSWATGAAWPPARGGSRSRRRPR